MLVSLGFMLLFWTACVLALRAVREHDLRLLEFLAFVGPPRQQLTFLMIVYFLDESFRHSAASGSKAIITGTFLRENGVKLVEDARRQRALLLAVH